LVLTKSANELVDEKTVRKLAFGKPDKARQGEFSLSSGEYMNQKSRGVIV